jgi:2-polyprenyl-3-methyl-5-hydroxy-6-metoxy-1,4-benzoquinol methylase
VKLTSTCRLCASPLHQVVVDLGVTPLANAYLRPDQLTVVEHHYPLRVLRCEECFLVQVETLVPPYVLFRDYAYYSSYSETLVSESKAFAETVISRLKLAPGDRVIEAASNDGYLLQFFLAAGLDVQGIEPADTVASAAVARGIPTVVRFFGSELARELAAGGQRAKLIIANNVLAHVPDPGDFIDGLRILLEPGGTITIEFHHLLSLIEHGQFDTIYHEHFQYFSLATAQRALAARALTVIDVEEIDAQGGSLRLYVKRTEDVAGPVSHAVGDVLAKEKAAGLFNPECYTRFAERVKAMKLGLVGFLIEARQRQQTVVAYGAAAKGSTLLNYCGVRSDLVEYVVDRNPHKQGLFLPGSRIPIRDPEVISETRPDYVLILPWNLSREIMRQMAQVRSWGGQFIVPVPELAIAPAEAGRTSSSASALRVVASGRPAPVRAHVQDESRRSLRRSAPHRSGT